MFFLYRLVLGMTFSPLKCLSNGLGKILLEYVLRIWFILHSSASYCVQWPSRPSDTCPSQPAFGHPSSHSVNDLAGLPCRQPASCRTVRAKCVIISPKCPIRIGWQGTVQCFYSRNSTIPRGGAIECWTGTGSIQYDHDQVVGCNARWNFSGGMLLLCSLNHPSLCPRGLGIVPHHSNFRERHHPSPPRPAVIVGRLLSWMTFRRCISLQ